MNAAPQPRWRRTLTAIDPLSRATSLAPTRDARQGRDRPPPAATAAGANRRPLTHPRAAVPGRRALHLAATALAAFVVAFASVCVAIGATAVALYGLIWLVGPGPLIGFAAGAAVVVAISEFTGWNRHRKLRELLDWLGEDNQARKMAALRHDQRIRYMRGELP